MSEKYNLKKYAELDKPPELSNRRKWFGIYKGVRFEINHFSIGDSLEFKNCWTHYIIVNLDEQLSKEKADSLWLEPTYESIGGTKKFASYRYYGTAIDSITFHGGCTFYKKESGPDDKARLVKIGCDYQHLSDLYHDYDEKYVYSEVRETIDSFVEHFGPIRIRSWGDGKYRFIEEYV